LLLGSSLMIDPIGRAFLVLLALLWLAAGWQAGARLRRRGPALLFLLAMSGCFALAVAGNLMVLLLASTVSGYALYGLAVRQPGARVFVVLLVLGDLLLFELLLLLMKSGSGLSLASGAAPSAAIGASTVLLLLTLLGFGAKAALFGLHAWLPRMLSGTAVELSPMLIGFVVGAGLLPWLRLLAPGTMPGTTPGAGLGASAMILAWVGLAAMGGAVMRGMLQGGRRALLGYAISALGGLWLVLLSVAGSAAGPCGAIDERTAALALGQAGLALAALLVQGGLPAARQSWLEWAIPGFAVFLLADALLAMLSAFAVDAHMPMVMSAYLLFGLLIGHLLWNGGRGDAAVPVRRAGCRVGLPLVLVLGAAVWALLMPAAQAQVAIAALVLLLAAAGGLLFVGIEPGRRDPRQ
jgi:multicomponent Na+:H+ antiporter subunit D